MEHAIAAWDPGLSGGVAIRKIGGEVLVFKNPADVVDLHGILISNSIKAVVFETQTGCTGLPISPANSFTFGAHYGEYLATFRLMGIRVVPVRAQTWQPGVGVVPTKNEKRIGGAMASIEAERLKRNAWLKTLRKASMRDMAQDLEPKLKVTLATCDAILILHYAIKQNWFSDTSRWISVRDLD